MEKLLEKIYGYSAAKLVSLSTFSMALNAAYKCSNQQTEMQHVLFSEYRNNYKKAIPQFPAVFAKYLLIFAFILFSSTAFSQTYPVQVVSQVTPPYTVHLADYVSPATNKWQVTLRLNELDRPEYRVKLRVTIEGGSIRIQSKQNMMPQPIILQGSFPITLTAADLAVYLDPANLDFSGITRTQFERTGALPENFYTFSVEVLDYQRRQVVSNKAMTIAPFFLNNPPLLNLPMEPKLMPFEPQFITFQWSPRHLGSPNELFGTEYVLRIYEIWPDNRDPNEVVRTSNPILTEITTQTIYQYGIADPPLEIGRKYAWQVQARDPSGRDVFKNQGFSEARMFQYGDPCNGIVELGAEALGTKHLRINWKGQWNHNKFNLAFRKKGSTQWNELETFIETHTIHDLIPDTEYEVRLMGYCGMNESVWSTPVLTIKTLTEEEVQFSCEEVEELSLPDNQEPISNLKVGDRITASGFKVIMVEVSASGDSYSGLALIQVPLFGFARFKAEFTNIKVNTDYQLIAGQIVSTINPDGVRWLDVDKVISQLDMGGSNDEEDPYDGTQPSDNFTGPVHDVSNPIGGADDIEPNLGNNTIIITHPDGSSTVVPFDPEKGTIIRDPDGNEYVVDPEGNVSGPYSPSPGDSSVQSTKVDYIVNFKGHTEQNYGFDAKKFDALNANYTQLVFNDEAYWIPWKSVEKGRMDKVSAAVFGIASFPDTLKFRGPTGEIVPTAGLSELEKTLNLQANNDNDEVVAYVISEHVNEEGQTLSNEIEVGRLNLAAYDLLRKKVILVPVNNAQVPTASQLQTELNRIYGQAVAAWEVNIANKFEVDAAMLEGLGDGESGMLASFPQKMRQFNRAYKNSVNIDKDAYYLFLIGGEVSSRAGFMPFKKQFGYIFTSNSTNFSKTIAHELGHGAFRLRHTFSNNAYIASKGSTDNLMDYRQDGTELYKHQWDYVHDPESMIGWFEDDDEAALEDSEQFDLKDLLAEINRLNKSGEKDFIDLSNWVNATSNNNIQKLNFERRLKLSKDEFLVGRTLFVNGKNLNKVDITNYEVEDYNAKYSYYGSESKAGKLIRFKNKEEDKIREAFPYNQNTDIALELWVINDHFEEFISYLRGANMSDDDPFIYFVTDNDARYRETSYPYKIKVKSEENTIQKGLRASISSIVEDDKGNEVAEIKLKDQGNSKFYTSKSNLSAVVAFPTERNYRLLKDYEPKTLPYLGKQTGIKYKKESKILADKYIQEMIKVTGVGGVIEGAWIEKSDLVWVDPIDKELFLSEAVNAKAVATKTVENETTASCNYCVRAALLLLREEPALFPQKGSMFHNPYNGFQLENIYGYISKDGYAHEIFEDFINLHKNIDLNNRFEAIDRKEDEGLGNFFERLQDKADTGEIIIGLMVNSSDRGHVVMITPGGLVEIAEADQQFAKYYINYGRNITKVPKVLECGTGARESEAALSLNVTYSGAVSMKWYSYKR